MELKRNMFLIARLARSDPRNNFVVSVSDISCAIYSILVYFVMFSFRVLTCLRIVSIRIILILNKFRHVWESYESSQFVSYWIWTSLDMLQHVQTCLRIISIHIRLILNKFRHVSTCSDMFENHINSCHIDSEQVKTCLRIVTIYVILILNKFRHVSTCSDMFENHINSYQIDSEQV